MNQSANRNNEDIELLRRYEPVVKYTQGEMFFPQHVEPYVGRSSLWTRSADGPRSEVLPAGSVTLAKLAELGREDSAASLSLRFVARPLNAREYQEWRKTRPPFRAGGRLARVGLLGRFVSAGFQLALLLRGRVPGGTVAAAVVQNRDVLAGGQEYVYHGRVCRMNGYTVLNYQFFHAMNDWRSSFQGANDHEADWEQIFVYLACCEDGSLQPAWVAYASHDNWGDDLRRRWDDPELGRIGDHPVVFSGAGSHASYFLPGDYVTQVEIRFLRPVAAIADVIGRFWHDILHQGTPGSLAKGVHDLIAVPFVDYARGDGLCIGPGQEVEWSPVVIGEDQAWVSDYRGLWGLDANDPFAGENAPSGPMYSRDGSVRHSWYDPVSWCGLDNEPLPGREVEQMRERIADLKHQIAATQDEIDSLRRQMPGGLLEARALSEGGRGRLAAAREADKQRRDSRMQELEQQREDLVASLRAGERFKQQLETGFRVPPQAHIRRKEVPQSPQYFSQGRVAEAWAVISAGVLLLAVAAALAFGSDRLVAVPLVFLTAMFVDSILRGAAVSFLLNLTILLAVATAAVLVYEYFWQVSLAAIALIGLLILLNNLREVRGR